MCASLFLSDVPAPIGGGEMDTNSNKAGRRCLPDMTARRFAAAAETAILAIAAPVPGGFSSVEQAQAERIRAAVARLLECADRLARDGLMIQGSMRQLRPHQLLKTEQELRSEVAEALQKLAVNVERRATFERLRAQTRKGGASW
jgi:acyl-coenzyme A synthetase/AMP-(fatty) acid ligase